MKCLEESRKWYRVKMKWYRAKMKMVQSKDENGIE